MDLRKQMAGILRAIISAVLSFFAGLGAYSAASYNTQGEQPKLRPQPNNIEQKQKVSPRPRLGNSCPSCGMG